MLGDWNEEDSDDVHDDDDDFWPDESCGDTDSSEDEYADEIDIGGTCVHPVPVKRQTCESNQYGEMLSWAAQFGKPYLAPGDQERQLAKQSRDSPRIRAAAPEIPKDPVITEPH